MAARTDASVPLWSAVLFAAGLLASALIALTLTRAPLVGIDEVYMASAALSIGQGGDGTPTIIPPSDTTFPFPLLHGPVFFWLDAAALKVAGANPAGGRLVSAVFAVLTAVAGMALVGVLTRSRTWALAAFGVMMLTPEISSNAGNGRMDTLAVCLELAGLAAFVWAATERPGAWWAAGAAGLCWSAAILTTTRTFPFMIVTGAAVATAGFAGRPFRRAALLPVCGIVVVPIVMGVTLWGAHWGVSPLEWFVRTMKGSTGTSRIMIAGDKAWSFSVANALGPLVLVPLVPLVAVTIVQRGVSRYATHVFVLTIALLTTALTMTVVTDVLHRGLHFTAIATTALIAGVAIDSNGWIRRLMMGWAFCGLLLFAAVRVAKTADVLETWDARSPHVFDAMLRDHVPVGSTVVGYDQFYLYAVMQRGATFQTFQLKAWALETRAFQNAWSDRISQHASPQVQADFLIWPDDPHFPLPDRFACVRPFVEARYDPPEEHSMLDRMPTMGGFAYLRRYPSTILYRVPSGCPQ